MVYDQIGGRLDIFRMFLEEVVPRKAVFLFTDPNESAKNSDLLPPIFTFLATFANFIVWLVSSPCRKKEQELWKLKSPELYGEDHDKGTILT